MSLDNNDKEIIELLLNKLNAVMGWHYKTHSYPDVENRKSKDIDLIAKCKGLPSLAFEETRITSFHNQVGFEKKIQKHYLGKASEYQNKIKSGISCLLPINIFSSDEGSFKKTSQLIINHLISIQDDIKIGRQFIQIPDIDLKVQIHFSKRPSSKFNFKIPIDEINLKAPMQKALDHKKEELLWYSNNEYNSILVISNYDNQNLSVVSVYEEFLNLAKNDSCKHLQYVFYNDCLNEWYCFKGKNIIEKGFNPVEL